MSGLFRKVISIPAASSPNVRRALRQIARGQVPDHVIETPGVLSYAEYRTRLQTWDKIRVCVGLMAQFYEGGELLLFPPEVLDHANRLARSLRGTKRHAKAVGIDTGEGAADTAFAAVDELGLIELWSYPTPDTNRIFGDALAFIKRHNVEPSRVCIDRGGGGVQLADRLRAAGLDVRTVAFGGTVAPEPRRRQPNIKTRIEEKEERYVYVNVRSQLFGELSELLDPSGERGGWAIPEEYSELRRQLAPIPRTYDGEGRLYLLPKNKKDASGRGRTLSELIGCSPDQADACALAAHGLLHERKRVVLGVS
jgi:hypothetical protein